MLIDAAIKRIVSPFRVTEKVGAGGASDMETSGVGDA